MQHTPHPNSKVLGEGTVRRLGGTVSLYSLKNGTIDIPYSAIRLNYERRVFEPEVGETLLYSATYDGQRYIAAAVVRPIDLQSFHGNLTLLDVGGKFGHVTITGKNTKIFVPFSARFNGGFWYGHGAVLEKVYSLMVFRQEEAHGCKYVAWSLSEGRGLNNLPPQHMDTSQQTSTMKKLGAPNIVKNPSDHLAVDLIKGHTGIIYAVSEDRVVSACSATTQLIYFPASLYQDWMKPGRFITFEAKTVSECRTDKVLGTSLEDIGALYPYSRTPFTMGIPAVLNKVVIGKAAWAWNDHIGRIFVPWNIMDKVMTATRPAPFTAVHLEIGFNGKHDEIPWVATAACLCSEEESPSVLKENAQLLKTEDGWKVQTLADGKDNPSIFLQKIDENRKLNAFAKNTDLNCAETPLVHTPVRVTYHHQQRQGRHVMRAVLITQLDKNNKPVKPHLMHVGSGRKQFPELYEQPTPRKERPVKTPASQKPQPPPKNCWNLSKLGSPKAPASSVLASQDFPAVNASQETKTAAVPPQALPANNIPSFSAEQERARNVSVWSGTPVEAKPEPVSFFNTNSSCFSTFTSDPSSSSFFSTARDHFASNGFAPAATTSNMLPGPITDLRNTQSESSSPGLKLDDHSETNCWSSLEPTSSGSFQFGFPAMDIPIFQKLVPGSDPSELPEPDVSKFSSCPCEIEKILSELWSNPRFVVAFASSDPHTFQRVQDKLNGSPHSTRNMF